MDAKGKIFYRHEGPGTEKILSLMRVKEVFLLILSSQRGRRMNGMNLWLYENNTGQSIIGQAS